MNGENIAIDRLHRMKNARKQCDDKSKIKSITCDIRQYASVTSSFTGTPQKNLLVWQCLFLDIVQKAYKYKTRSY